MEIFTPQERKAAGIIQRDLPLTRQPFTAVADACGLTTDQMISFLKKLSGNGVLRKIGAILRHQKAGYRKNALVIWYVPPDRMEEAGQTFASLPFISHCYEREPAFQGKYNLFTMLHTQDDSLSSTIETMAQLINCRDFLILESQQEYKKTSPEYF